MPLTVSGVKADFGPPEVEWGTVELVKPCAHCGVREAVQGYLCHVDWLTVRRQEVRLAQLEQPVRRPTLLAGLLALLGIR